MANGRFNIGEDVRWTSFAKTFDALSDYISNKIPIYSKIMVDQSIPHPNPSLPVKIRVFFAVSPIVSKLVRTAL